MKVIVCGAGQVGSNIARQLAAEDIDVIVIDQSPDLIRKIGDSLDVQAMVGFASHPDVLERAGASEADMLIAVTFADEVNMVACQVAHSLFNVPTKIARVRSQSYLNPIWADLFSRDNLPIDVIISPEIEVANAIARRLQVPGAFDMIPLADGKVSVIGVRVGDECPVANTPLRQLTELFPELHIVVVGIFRDGEPIVPSSDDQMLPGDDVYFVCDSEHIERSMAAFGYDNVGEARRIVIIGGGNIGLYLAREIEAEHEGVKVKIIEIDRERAQEVAQALDHTIVLHGDGLDPELLEEANVRAAEMVVAVSNDDEVNILSSLLAKRSGCPRAVTLVNNMAYEALITTLGVDVVVNPRDITASTILQHIRRGRIRSVHSLREGLGEIIEAEALETAQIVGAPLKEVRLPKGLILGAIVRDGQVVMPRPETVVNTGDRVVIFAATEAIRKVEKLFSVRLEYF